MKAGRPIFSLLVMVGVGAFVLIDPGRGAVPNFASRPSQAIVLKPPRTELPSQESLVYEVRWFGIPVGRGRIAIEATDPEAPSVFEVRAEAYSYPFLSRFYEVKDEMKSLYDADGSTSLMYEKNLREGRYRAHEITHFDYPKKKAYWKSLTNGSEQELDLPGHVLDVLSAFYWFRTQEVSSGQRVRAKVHADEKDWDVEIEVLGYERIELLDTGVFDTLVAEPHAAFKGVLVDRARTRVYLTADEKRIPLQFRIDTRFGPFLGIILCEAATPLSQHAARGSGLPRSGLAATPLSQHAARGSGLPRSGQAEAPCG